MGIEAHVQQTCACVHTQRESERRKVSEKRKEESGEKKEREVRKKERESDRERGRQNERGERKETEKESKWTRERGREGERGRGGEREGVGRRPVWEKGRGAENLERSVEQLIWAWISSEETVRWSSKTMHMWGWGRGEREVQTSTYARGETASEEAETGGRRRESYLRGRSPQVHCLCQPWREGSAVLGERQRWRKGTENETNENTRVFTLSEFLTAS